MKPIYFSILVCFVSNFTCSLAQIIEGTRIKSLGGNSPALSDLFSINPASFVHKSSIGTVNEHPFLLNELSKYSVNGIWITPIGNIGGNISYSGHANFHRSRYSVSYSKLLNESFSAGVRIGAHQEFIKYRESLTIPEGTVGIQFPLTEQTRLGSSLFISRSNNNNYFTTGISHYLDKTLLLTSLLINESTTSIQFGIEHSFTELLTFRVGLHTVPIFYSVGLGLKSGPYQFDFVYAFHPILGSTLGISISYELD